LDAKRFDALACLVDAAVSRRAAMGGLLGLGLAGVVPRLSSEQVASARKKKKKCKGGKKKCGKKCCLPETCFDGACCPADRACGEVCCASSQVCADSESSLCVVGTGTCQPGNGSCNTSNFVFCNGSEECVCALATNGVVRCGTPIATATLDDCGKCSSNADCAVSFPDVPGAFCAVNATSPCSCAPGENLCVAPCPVV
jgi:hypothetical protein